MTIITENNLRNFQFWGGAKDWANCFTCEELDTIEEMLEDCYPEGINETTINDLFWFEPETLCEWLGIDFEEDLCNR